jgi:hypothetical protein
MYVVISSILKIYGGSVFKDAHSGRICVHVFVGVSVCEL